MAALGSHRWAKCCFQGIIRGKLIMKNNNIKLGDLVKLDGLQRPAAGVLKVELWGKAEKVKKLEEGMSDFAGKVEDHQDVNVGEVAGLVEVMKKALVKELSPEKVIELLKVLKKRFEIKKKFYKYAEGIKWEDVEKKLQDSPEKMWSLQQMEDTGGEPDVVEFDQKTREYIFMDCSAESPTGRRNCVYDRDGEVELKKRDPSANYKSNAVSMAAFMGVDILNEKEYRELQTKGEFDKQTLSWIKTPVDKRKTGVALRGYRLRGGVLVRGDLAHAHFGYEGWRASLRV